MKTSTFDRRKEHSSDEEASKYLADPKFHLRLIKVRAVNGFAWLKTDTAVIRNDQSAIGGINTGLCKAALYDLVDDNSFRAEIRVKKVK